MAGSSKRGTSDFAIPKTAGTSDYTRMVSSQSSGVSLSRSNCDGGRHREGHRGDVFRLNVEIERRWKTWSRRYMGSKGLGGDQERHT